MYVAKKEDGGKSIWEELLILGDKREKEYYSKWIDIIGMSSLLRTDKDSTIQMRIMEAREFKQGIIDESTLYNIVNKMSKCILKEEYIKLHKILIDLFLEPITKTQVIDFSLAFEDKSIILVKEIMKNRNIRLYNLIRRLNRH